MTHTREQLRSIEWAIHDEDGGSWCPACQSSADIGHKMDCWLAASLSAPLSAEHSSRGVDGAATTPNVADMLAASLHARAVKERGACPTCGGVWPCDRCTTRAVVDLDELKARLSSEEHNKDVAAMRLDMVAAQQRAERAEGRLREISDLLEDAGVPGGTTLYGGVLMLRERAERAEAALSSAPPDLAWLIERHHGSRLEYWTGDRDRWSANVEDGRRFSRREDAACMLTWHCDDVGRVAEHMWSPVAPVGAPMGMPGDAGHDQWGYPLSLRTSVPASSPVAPAPPVAETPATEPRIHAGIDWDYERSRCAFPSPASPVVAPAPSETFTEADRGNEHPWVKRGPYPGPEHTGMPFPVAPAPVVEDSRCAVCGWPLDSDEQFCRRGNCSARPLPERCYDAPRALREYGVAGWKYKVGPTIKRWQEQAAALSPRETAPGGGR